MPQNAASVRLLTSGPPEHAKCSKTADSTAGPAEEDDFLPLPISEQFKLPSKKASKAGQHQGRELHSRDADAAGDNTQARVNGQRKVKEGQKPFPMEKKQKIAGTLPPHEEERGRQAHSSLHESRDSGSRKPSRQMDATAAEKRPEGVQAKKPKKAKASTQVVSVSQQQAEDRMEQPTGNAEEHTEPVVVFDFEAARQSSAGLDVLGGMTRTAHSKHIPFYCPVLQSYKLTYASSEG